MNIRHIRRISAFLMMGLVLTATGCLNGNKNAPDNENGQQTIKEAESGSDQEMIEVFETGTDQDASRTKEDGLSREDHTEEKIETSQEEHAISIVMVGDILLHTPVSDSAKTEDGSYDFSAIFANMEEEIEAADLAMVNQEVIIGGEELGVSGYPAFNAPYAIADSLYEAGFDVVLHATNHALDKGKKGILNCLSYWENNYPNMLVTGVYDSKENADEILVTEVDGIAIAILNYTYGTNGISIPEDMPYAVNMLTQDKVESDIKRAKEMADFVIVCPHWGTEYRLMPDASQEKWTKIFLENGVDLVIGTHPHVIEPIEMIYDEENDHEMLVYYSLGNFVNWTSGTGEGVANRMVGGMALVSLEKKENGEVCIADYGVRAVVAHVTSGFGGVSVIPLSEYSQKMAEKNEIISQDGDFSKEYAVNLCDEVWGELWH